MIIDNKRRMKSIEMIEDNDRDIEREKISKRQTTCSKYMMYVVY